LAASEVVSAFAQSVFGLSGSEFALAVTQSINGKMSFSVHAAKLATRDWKYMEVLQNNVIECAGVCSPESSTEFPPTAASQLLVGAWLSNHTLLNGSAINASRSFIVGTKSVSGPSSFPARLLTEWAAVCPFLERHVVPPVWVSKSQLRIKSPSQEQFRNAPQARFNDLFIEAVSEIKIKWRYLALYRIFEHGYLLHVFDKLKADFFLSPKESLTAATNSLDSELNQLLALVKDVALDSHFAEIYDKFVTIKNAGNRFACALEHSYSKGEHYKVYKESKIKQGVLVCYKIRCSIVHAGVSSPIFDSYPDAGACLEALVSSLEIAAIHFLEIEIE